MVSIAKGYTGGRKLPRPAGNMSSKPATGKATRPKKGPKPRSG